MSDKVNALNYTTVNIATSGTTDKGTKIVAKNSNGGNMDKNAFLKILAAQLSNLDPTQNQDSSAYVSQMAQFASMEQMQNLNNTISDSSYQQMAGKTVITNEKDNSNNYIQGYVTQVIKKSGGTYLNLLVNGKYKEVPVANVIGVTQGTDTNALANNKTALNSDFIAASALAADKKNIVIAEYDKDGNATLVKGKVTGAYIDTVNTASVKIKVEVSDANGNTTNKTYDYENIVRAGDLTQEEMDAAEKSVTDKIAAEKAAAEAAAKAAAEAAAKESTDTTSSTANTTTGA